METYWDNGGMSWLMFFQLLLSGMAIIGRLSQRLLFSGIIIGMPQPPPALPLSSGAGLITTAYWSSASFAGKVRRGNIIRRSGNCSLSGHCLDTQSLLTVIILPSLIIIIGIDISDCNQSIMPE